MTKDSFIFDTSIPAEAEEMKGCVDLLIMAGAHVEVKKYKPTRSNLQNRSLHLFFRMVSDLLNESGCEFEWKGLRGDMLSTQWTETLVKERIWRQLQIALFGIESTTKINTTQINTVLDVIIRWFGEKGIKCSFPNKFDYYLEHIKKHK